MNISQTFIERPIATSLLMAAIALFGSVAYRQLAVSDLPNVDFPTLLVTAALPGATPETMAAAVAPPLENQFSPIAGMNSMSSSNSLGNTQIALEFDLARKLDGAAEPVLHHRRHEFDVQFELARQHPDHPRIRSRPQARRCRRRRAGRHHPSHPPSSPGHAYAAHLHQGQSRRPTHSLSRPDFAHPAPLDPHA